MGAMAPKASPSRETLLHEKARILVTGAGGFIGSALVHELNRRGLQQIVITDFLGEDEKWKNLLPLEFEDYVPAGEFLEGIARDPDQVLAQEVERRSQGATDWTGASPVALAATC